MVRIIASPEDRREELFDLNAKVFSGGAGGYFKFLRHCREYSFSGSSYDWSVSRVAEDDGRIVAHVGIWQYRMRVGAARLRTGGVGAVATHGDYRRRGIASSLMRAVIGAMRQAGYHFSVLGGRRGFYDRLGYVPAWPGVRHVVDTEALPGDKLKLALRKAPLTEVLRGPGAVMRIYERENATRTGTAVRPIYTRSLPLFGAECRMLSDSAGRVRGYLVTRKSTDRSGADELRVLEAGGFGRSCGAGQLLAAIRRLARRAGCAKVCVVNIAYDHPLCEALRGSDCRVEMNHARSGGTMAAVISLRGCLEALAGELTDRLRRSTMKDFAGTLSISGAGETIALGIARGRVRVAPKARSAHRLKTCATPANRIVAGPAVARLLIGSADPATLAVQSNIRFSGRAGELAEALFPKQWPMLNELDNF